MASKQDNYLRMHHPSLYKGMKKGGEVKKKKYYAEGGKNTDTVPAMLTPGEVVLNAEQQEALGKLVGMKPAALFEKIGIPGFAGGGMATKEDALMQYYENGGITPREIRRRESEYPRSEYADDPDEYLEELGEERALKDTKDISKIPLYREHLMYPMKKSKGLKGALQRFLPGGKSGWKTSKSPTKESWAAVTQYQKPHWWNEE